MTLHLSARWGSAIYVASDRLLTYSTTFPGRRGQFDIYANKNLVLLAKRGIAYLSYTGIAYIGSVSTDAWIAEVLWRERLPQQGMSIVGQPTTKPALDLGMLANELATKLSAEFRRIRSNQRLAVSFLGWQWPGRGSPLESIMWTVDNLAGNPREFEVHRLPSALPDPNRSRFWSFPNNPAVDRQRLGARVAAAQSDEDVFSALRDEIRAVAAVDDSVGVDVLEAKIDPSLDPHVVTSFNNGPAPRVAIQSGDAIGGLSFSPWIVGRTLLALPSVAGGSNLSYSGDGFQVQLGGNPECPWVLWVRQPRQGSRLHGPSDVLVTGLEEFFQRTARPDQGEVQ